MLFAKRDNNSQSSCNIGGLSSSSTQPGRFLACRMEQKRETHHFPPCSTSTSSGLAGSKKPTSHFGGDFADLLRYRKCLEQMDRRRRGHNSFGWPHYSCEMFSPTRTFSRSRHITGWNEQRMESKKKMTEETAVGAQGPKAEPPAVTYASVLKKPKTNDVTSNEQRAGGGHTTSQITPENGFNNLRIFLNINPCFNYKRFSNGVGGNATAAACKESLCVANTSSEVPEASPGTHRGIIQHKMDFLKDLVSSSTKCNDKPEIGGRKRYTTKNLNILPKTSQSLDKPVRLHKTETAPRASVPGSLHGGPASPNSSNTVWPLAPNSVRQTCTNALISFIMGMGISESVDDEVDDTSDWDSEGSEEEDSQSDMCMVAQLNHNDIESKTSNHVDDKLEEDCGIAGLDFGHVSEKELAEANLRWQKAYENCDLKPLHSSKKVTFAQDESLRTVHDIPSYSRKGHWEELARDRHRFLKHIRETESVLSPVLLPAFREKVFLDRILPSLNKTTM